MSGFEIYLSGFLMTFISLYVIGQIYCQIKYKTDLDIHEFLPGFILFSTWWGIVWIILVGFLIQGILITIKHIFEILNKIWENFIDRLGDILFNPSDRWWVDNYFDQYNND